MSKKIKILSIDGGGIRGILPGIIISYIEEALQKAEGPQKRISDYFDLVAGTSTGGLLTLIYLTPDLTSMRPKFTAKQAVDLYITRGEEIFSISLWQKMKSAGGLTDEKYSASALEEALNDYLGDIRLSQLLKPCLITAYDIRNRKAKFFNSVDAVHETKDYYIKDIARATSAAPTYFEPARIKSLYGTPYPLIDGGVFANNPAMCAYAEARTMDFSKILSNPEIKAYPGIDDMMILSVGTGSQKTPYYYEEAKDWGALGWLKPIIDILMSGNSETVDYQLRKLFCAEDNPLTCNYIRLEPKIISADSAMDNGTIENIRALTNDGKQFVEENKKQLDAIVNRLLSSK